MSQKSKKNAASHRQEAVLARGGGPKLSLLRDSGPLKIFLNDLAAPRSRPPTPRRNIDTVATVAKFLILAVFFEDWIEHKMRKLMI